MEPGPLDLTVVQGATFRLKLTWKAPDPDDTSGTPTRVPVDLTGWKARAQVRVRGSVVLTFDSEDTEADGTITLGGPDGTLELYCHADVVRSKRHGPGKWSLEVESPNGDRDVLLAGASIVKPETTSEA